MIRYCSKWGEHQPTSHEILCISNMYTYTYYICNYRTMPISLFVGIPVVTVCYLLVNVSFFLVLSYEEILSAKAVALVSWTVTCIMECSTCMYHNIIIHVHVRGNFCQEKYFHHR